MPETHARHAPDAKADEHEPEPLARRGRPVGDRDAKRTELLAAAIAVIAQEGYAGATMRKVAQYAGCTTGTVTYYFANKEEMVSAVAQNLFDKVDALLDINLDQVDIRSLIQRWHHWISHDEPDNWLAWLQLLTHARHQPAFASVIKQRYAHYRQVATSVLEAGQRQGKVREDVPADVLADHVAAFSDGWLMMLPLEPEPVSAERGKALIDAFIVMISPAETAKRTAKSKAAPR
ncbi:TetR/AcrR family transcriptional regulator [Pseudomonas sp. Kh13]|uniref:TetR/AcrR family transcriptional regulator n=1 Tax=Pseudomonas sp. Kh13 TaxID=2093744 RepID=UPI001183CFD5|nr:TetR/AcrR family transcriptional regulator [Pseudomonas sp. Kh13]